MPNATTEAYGSHPMTAKGRAPTRFAARVWIRIADIRFVEPTRVQCRYSGAIVSAVGIPVLGITVVGLQANGWSVHAFGMAVPVLLAVVALAGVAVRRTV